jgi:hypothetical protein
MRATACGRSATGQIGSALIAVGIYCRMGSGGRHPLWEARLAGSTQCMLGGFLGPHAFGMSGPKSAFVIQTMDNSFFYPAAADYLTNVIAAEDRRDR